jgi:hypothetical protein
MVLWVAVAHAEPLPKDDNERSCWLQHTRERTRVRLNELTSVDVANMRDGYTVRSPFRIDFAIRGMGVIPAGKAHPKAGHHHILVDTPLPIRPGDQIPFNDFHRHFGKGQTGTVVSLAPGAHTVRLLFADHEHRPYFVFSPELKINVSGPRTEAKLRIDPKNFEASCKAWYEDEVTKPRPEGQRAVFSNLRDGESVVSPFNLRLAADGLGVAPRGHGGPANGHFMVDVVAAGRTVQVVDLGNGATQTNLYVPVGAYTLRVRLLDDTRTRELAPGSSVNVVVTAQERL